MSTSIEEYVQIDKRVDAAEEQGFAESLRERWEFGKRMVAGRVGKRYENLGELAEATGKSPRELGYRMQFAEQYPTEDDLRTAVRKFNSWIQVKKSLTDPGKRRGPGQLPEMTTYQRDEFLRLHEDEGIAWTKAEAQVRGWETPRASLTTEAQQIRAGIHDTEDDDTPTIDWASLPGTAQQKLETMRRQVRKELELEFEPRVQAEVQNRVKFARKRIDQMELESRRVLDARKGILSRANYDLIRSSLHPDSRLSITDEKLAEAFRIFNEAEILFLNEKDRPTTLPSMDELRKRRRA
jgi:hypothetical protein